MKMKRSRNAEGPQQECEKDIEMHEVERVLEEAANNKAAGEDDIPYELLKMLGPKARHKFWRGSELPTKWRKALIKALLKEGKDPKDTKSYRPISLLSCMSKLL